MNDKKMTYLKYGLHGAVIVGVIIAAVRYLNGQEILKALQSFSYSLAPWMVALSAGYLSLKAWRFVILMRPVSDVAVKTIFKGFVAGQAITLLPGGVAARAGLMNQVGVPVAKSSAPVALSSGLDQVVFIAGSLIAALWFAAARVPVLIIMAILLAVGLIAWIPKTRRWLARLADWITGKLGVRQQWHNFLETVPQVITWRIMVPALAITLVAFAFKIVTLDLSLQGIGQDLAYPTLFLAFILPTMLGRIFPIPAGIGVTEASMVGFLASTSSIDPDTATAAVAIFRVVTVLFQAFLGALVYFLSWRGEEEATTLA